MNSMLRRKHTYQTEKLTRCYRQQKLIHTMIQTTKKHWLTMAKNYTNKGSSCEIFS